MPTHLFWHRPLQNPNLPRPTSPLLLFPGGR